MLFGFTFWGLTSCPYNFHASSGMFFSYLIPHVLSLYTLSTSIEVLPITLLSGYEPAAGHPDMSTQSTSDAFRFPKLKGSNYFTWSDYMQAVLQAKYLWLLVKGSELYPTEPPVMQPASQTLSEYKADKKEYLDWLLQDEAAQGVIKGACEDSKLPHMKGCKMSKELWVALKKVIYYK
jgi:hypothetical protein